MIPPIRRNRRCHIVQICRTAIINKRGDRLLHNRYKGDFIIHALTWQHKGLGRRTGTKISTVVAVVCALAVQIPSVAGLFIDVDFQFCISSSSEIVLKKFIIASPLW